MFLKRFLSLLGIFLYSFSSYAQWSTDFISYQKSFPRVNEAYNKRMDTLMQQCIAKGIGWPLQQVYLRSFKLENIIELWVKDESNPKFQFFKAFKVCGSNGKLGPKRKEGDKQVPEGFYYINQFNPNSNYHLSLGINYPNVSDRILADAVKPGGEIYIHGDCVSVGCLAINDEQIEDLYLLSAIAKSSGQEYVPVHIFPAKFNASKSKEVVGKILKENTEYTPFVNAMQSVFYYFEKERQLPAILINGKGQYVIEDVEIPVTIDLPPGPTNLVRKLTNHKIRKYKPNEVANNVNKFPVFEGGNDAYANFLKTLSNELSAYLDETQKKTYVYAEFVVNIDGTVTNVEVKKGGNEVMNDVIKTRLENTIDWMPAQIDGVSVAYKMTQTFFIEQTTPAPLAK
jgi:murein L,D-transpeptidase YafK